MKTPLLLLFFWLTALSASAHKDPWYKDQSGWNPLMKCAYNNDTLGMDSLLKKETPDQADSRGWTALKVAVKKGNQSAVAYLLKRGASPGLADSSGYTPLMEACLHSHYEITKMLLEKGADPNASLPNGWTALMAAVCVEDGDLMSMELLIQYKADINAKRKTDGFTVLKFAEYNGDKRKISRLKELGAR